MSASAGKRTPATGERATIKPLMQTITMVPVVMVTAIVVDFVFMYNGPPIHLS